MYTKVAPYIPSSMDNLVANKKYIYTNMAAMFLHKFPNFQIIENFGLLYHFCDASIEYIRYKIGTYIDTIQVC